jgi:hypothetical protein
VIDTFVAAQGVGREAEENVKEIVYEAAHAFL